MRQTGRLGETAVVYRCHRIQAGGGFGDQERHPFAWGVLVYLDGGLGANLFRPGCRAGIGPDLTRLEKWMRDQGFWYWWMRNDLEPVGASDSGGEAEEDDVLPSSPPLP